MDKRTDQHMEQLIRNGILTEMQYGTVHAWAYLLRNGVDEALIMRVLLSVNRRADDTAGLLSLRQCLIAGVCCSTPAGSVRPADAIPRTTAIDNR